MSDLRGMRESTLLPCTLLRGNGLFLGPALLLLLQMLLVCSVIAINLNILGFVQSPAALLQLFASGSRQRCLKLRHPKDKTKKVDGNGSAAIDSRSFVTDRNVNSQPSAGVEASFCVS